MLPRGLCGETRHKNVADVQCAGRVSTTTVRSLLLALFAILDSRGRLSYVARRLVVAALRQRAEINLRLLPRAAHALRSIPGRLATPTTVSGDFDDHSDSFRRRTV